MLPKKVKCPGANKVWDVFLDSVEELDESMKKEEISEDLAEAAELIGVGQECFDQIDQMAIEKAEMKAEALKYPGRHYSDFGFKAPLHAYFSPCDAEKAGTATWITVVGKEVEVTCVRPGYSITACPTEIYVGDVIACIRNFDENKG